MKAVKFLKAKSDSEGYFVMIEAGRIDAAHHNGQAVRALSETLAFDRAVEEVLKLVDLEDTLVILTADHSHTMTYAFLFLTLFTMVCFACGKFVQVSVKV